MEEVEGEVEGGDFLAMSVCVSPLGTGGESEVGDRSRLDTKE